MTNIYLDNVRYIQELIRALQDFLECTYQETFSRAPPLDDNMTSEVTIIEKSNGIVAGYFEYDVIKNMPTDVDEDEQSVIDFDNN